MNIIFSYWTTLFIFLVSLAFIVYERKKKEELEAQFVVTTGCLLIVFYVICALSGICTILNFLWNWVL